MLQDPIFIFRRHQVGVTFIRYISGKIFISGDELGDIIVWNLLCQEPIFQSLRNSTHSRLNAIKALDVIGSENNTSLERIVTQTFDGTIQLWNALQCKVIAQTRTNATQLSRFYLLKHGGEELGASSGGILYLIASKEHDKILLHDLMCSTPSRPLLQTVPIAANKIKGWFDGPTSVSPGWICGIQPLAQLGPTYILVAYEAFGVFDLRKPNTIVSDPVAVCEQPETTTSFRVAQDQSWIGTSNGQLVVSYVNPVGNIEVVKRLDVQTQVQKETYHSYNAKNPDILEYEKEVLDCRRSHCKLGIGDIALTPCRSVALVGGWDGNLYCFNTSTFNLSATLTYHTQPISCLDVHSLGDSFAVASYVGLLYFFLEAVIECPMNTLRYLNCCEAHELMDSRNLVDYNALKCSMT